MRRASPKKRRTGVIDFAPPFLSGSRVLSAKRTALSTTFDPVALAPLSGDLETRKAAPPCTSAGRIEERGKLRKQDRFSMFTLCTYEVSLIIDKSYFIIFCACDEQIRVVDRDCSARFGTVLCENRLPCDLCIITIPRINRTTVLQDKRPRGTNGLERAKER